MPTEWREGKEKFERGHLGDDQLLRDTQECGIFFKGTQVKASPECKLEIVSTYELCMNGPILLLDEYYQGLH
jgi:tmRNA-binding protein